MRRRWLLTSNASTPSSTKKDFNELVFPLNDSALAADHAVESSTYRVSAGSTAVELPSDLPEDLRTALLKYSGDGDPAAAKTVGIAIQFSSVWWLDSSAKRIRFWCWNNPADQIHEVNLDTSLGQFSAAVLAGGRIDPQLIRIMPQLAEKDQPFRAIDSRRDNRTSNLESSESGPPNLVSQTMLVITTNGIHELALSGSEEDGVHDHEFHKDSGIRCPKNLAEFSASYHHQASGRTFFAVNASTAKGGGGGVWEYRPYSIDEVYITLNSALVIGDGSTWMESWKRGAMFNIVQKIFYREKPNRISTTPTLHPLMDLPRRWFGRAAGELKFIQFCESGNDTIYLALENLEIYNLILQPPVIQTESEAILKYSERPTLVSIKPVLTRSEFFRSLNECLVLSTSKNTSNAGSGGGGGEPSKKLFEENAREPRLIGITAVGHGAIEILLDDATRVTCSSALSQRAMRWTGRVDDPGKSIHDSLRLRSDPYIWSYLQLSNHHSVSTTQDPPPFVVTHVRWPPNGICEESQLYRRTHRWSHALQAPTTESNDMNYSIVTAASSGVSHSGAATTSGCWLALRCASQRGESNTESIGHLVMLNGRDWQVITSGTSLLAWSQSKVSIHYRSLLESERDRFLWSSARRIELAAVISQLQKIRSIPVMISTVASSFGNDGMPQLSLLTAKSLGGLIGLTTSQLFGARKNGYSDILRNHLPGLQNIIDAMFKDLNFSLPFMPHGGLQVQDPSRLVAALERYATLPLNGLQAWAELASRQMLTIDLSDAQSNLVRSIRPPDAAWLLFRGESHRAIDMCWHFLATESVPLTAERKADYDDQDDISGYATTVTALKTCADKSIDTCCRLLFSLTSLGRLQEDTPIGHTTMATGQRETNSLLSLKRFILQLIADFSHCPLFEVALNGVLVAHAIDSTDESALKNPSQNNNGLPASRKRTLRERDNVYTGSKPSTDLSINLRLSADDYRKGLECCQSLQRAFQTYDSFMKTQVSLDVRNKVQEDAAKFSDVVTTLDTLQEVFEFMILLAEGIAMEREDFVSDSLRTTSSGGGQSLVTAFKISSGELPQISVEAELLYQLAQLSFASLVGNIILEGENSLIRRWFDEGSLLKLVSPTSLVGVCANLFDKPSLEWSAAVEPLLAFADKFDMSHFDRRRQQTERVQAQSSSSSSQPIAGALDYLFSVWQEAADSDNLKDLDICLPLPKFVRDAQGNGSYQGYGPTSEVLNLAVGDDLRAQLRTYAIKALQTFVMVGRDKGEYYKDAMFQQLLDILFRIHAYDFLHLTLATWADVVSRYHIWSRININDPNMSSSNTHNDLHPKISGMIHHYLSRLAKVVITTEKIIGWDLLIALIRQLTCYEIPVFWTDVDLNAFSASLQPYKQPIAFSVFEWMFASEQSALNLTTLPDLLKSPHITAWLDLQNQNNHATEAHTATTKVSEVYLSQKNYGQALNMMLTNLDSQPSWLSLPIHPSHLAESRLAPENIPFRSKLKINGTTLSCIRGLIDPCNARDMRDAFRKKLLAHYQASDDWNLAVEFVELLRETGSFPIDHRIEVLLKCLVLSVISDADGSGKNGNDQTTNLEVRSEKMQPTQTTSLLSSQVRRMLTQNHQPHNLLDQFNKINAVGGFRLGSQNEPNEQLRINSSLLSARKSDASQRMRLNDGRRLSPRCSQILPGNIWSGTPNLTNSQLQLAGTSPVLQPLPHQMTQPALNSYKKLSVIMLGDEDAERLKTLSASQGLVLDKMAETLALPSYVSKNSSGLGLRRSETDRLRHAQTKLLSQWAMVQDMTEYITFLMIDNDGESSLASRIIKLIDAQKSRAIDKLAVIDMTDSRAELLQNAVGLLMKLLHSHFATPYALIDCMLKLAVANAKVAPMNLISVLECWGQLDERRLRLNDAYELLPASLSHLNGDVAVCIVVANSTVAERLVLAKKHRNYSLITDMTLRFWNVFALSLIEGSSASGSERHTERRILLEGNASPPLRLFPGILWRFMIARLSESSEQEDQPNWLCDDVRGLCERKTRLNLFLNTWEEGLLGEHEAHVFVYESCVRVFIWDLIGLTRCSTTAADYDTLEDLVQMSYLQPSRIINVLKAATHWLFAIGMTLLQDLDSSGGGYPNEPLAEPGLTSTDFTGVSNALRKFFGFSMDTLFIQSVFNNVVKDLIDLINWLSHISLPGLADCWSALAAVQNVNDTRYIAPVLQQAIETCKSACQAATETKTMQQGQELSMFFGRAFYESGIDEISPLLNGTERPKWLIDAKPLIPPSQMGSTNSTGLPELINALLDSVAAAGILATHAQSTSAVHTLNTVLKNYKLCALTSANSNYSSRGAL